MAYCAWTDITDIISTTLDQTAIEGIIEESDAEIDLRIGAQTAGNKVIKKLSKLMTAIQVKTEQPTAMAAGEYRETHNPVPVWQAEVERIFMFAKSSSGKVVGTPYEHIDEDNRYQEDLRT